MLPTTANFTERSEPTTEDLGVTLGIEFALRFSLLSSRPLGAATQTPHKKVLLGDFEKSTYLIQKELDQDPSQRLMSIDVTVDGINSSYAPTATFTVVYTDLSTDVLNMQASNSTFATGGSCYKVSLGTDKNLSTDKTIDKLYLKIWDANATYVNYRLNLPNNKPVTLGNTMFVQLTQANLQANPLPISTSETADTSYYTMYSKAAMGLVYFGARYYDPEIGIFLSIDPVMQDWFAYAYCSNNPINRIDPDGRESAIMKGNQEAKQLQALWDAGFSDIQNSGQADADQLKVAMEYKEKSKKELEKEVLMKSLADQLGTTIDKLNEQMGASNSGREGFLAQINLATAGSLDGYAASTTRQMNSILNNRFSYKAGTDFLKASARQEVGYLRGNLGFYKGAGRAMTGVGVGFGLLDAAGYYSVGDSYNAGKALWQTGGGYIGGVGGAALFSPSGPGAFVGGAGGSFIGSWAFGALYDVIY